MSSGHPTELGILPNLPASEYHEDRVADVPSLSASIAKLLINQSPAHAFAQHPRLNPHFVRVEESKFDVGTVAHSVLLEGIDAVEIIEADDWRTKSAKEARELARANGKIPLLGKHYFDVLAMVDAAKKQLAEHQAFPALFTDGKPEQTIAWVEDGVQCKARLDWLHDDHCTVDDLKTTARSARHSDVERLIYNMGYDLQAAFYVRGCKAVTGVVPEFRFAFIETAAPYALSVSTPSPAMYELANDRLDKGIRTWKHCLETGVWPGYDRRVATVDPPVWAEAQWMEREAA